MTVKTSHVKLLIAFITVVVFVLLQVAALANAGLSATELQTTSSPTPTISYTNKRNPRPESQGLRPELPSELPSVSYWNSDTDADLENSEPRVTPDRISVTLNPGESYNTQVHVFTGGSPISKGDVMFLFDRTGSMSDEIDQVKTSALQIMNDVRGQLPDTWFGVGSFMDYPGSYDYPGYSDIYGNASDGDVPWELNINPTDNITDVADVINELWLGNGEDWPEDYTRALYEVTSVEWRPDTKKIVVLFGDAPTHDLDFAGYNFGGDPGLDGVAMTDDDLDFETVVQQVADEGLFVIAVDSGYDPESEATFKGMSIGYDTAPGTNGQYFQLDDPAQIPTAVVELIGEETQRIDRLSLQATEGYESWVQVPPPEIDVGGNITKTFDITITVPSGTSLGSYPFQIQAVGDGNILGLTHVEVTVPSMGLAQGYNVISLPSVPGGAAAPAEVLASVEGSYNHVYAFDGCDAADSWKIYDPSAPGFVNDLGNIDVTMGLEIEMNTPATLAVSDTAPASTDIPLCAGWNLIGYPSLESRSVEDVLASIAGQFERVWALDASDPAGSWKLYDPSAPDFVNDLTEFRPGYGYWILVTEDTTLTIEN